MLGSARCGSCCSAAKVDSAKVDSARVDDAAAGDRFDIEGAGSVASAETVVVVAPSMFDGSLGVSIGSVPSPAGVDKLFDLVFVEIPVGKPVEWIVDGAVVLVSCESAVFVETA